MKKSVPNPLIHSDPDISSGGVVNAIKGIFDGKTSRWIMHHA